VHSDTYAVTVDPVRAGFSAWYEMFPRSASPDAKRHGTLKDVTARLDYVSRLGFNVLYLPPIHPIGRQFRKGPNNTASGDPADPGVPWAIGGPDGGHTAVNPDLGTLADFDALVAAARAKDIDVALDIAFQASPDHPWVTEHPAWFKHRPDGTIQYAENPPKKYQDIYPFDFESADWRGLWQALNDVFRFWISHGVTIFRVDNPHTKAFAFWEWCIADIKRDHPEAIFLAEAFTRPRPMHRLAKLGFSQSYTYFTWRNTAAELRTYLTELTSLPSADYFRPNFWPNTPDILHADLQQGGRAAFQARAVLAATLSPNWGIYGPAFELMEAVPREAGSEEYLDSEKYQQRTWDLARADSLAPLITTINAARRDHPALQSNERLVFHEVNSEWLLAYSKRSADGRDVILAVVNMDYRSTRAGTLVLDLDVLGLPADAPFEAHDLLDGATYTWRGARNWVSLDPEVRAAHLLWLRPAP
jgi:starch synthase (maltosyl-transferring)